MTKNEILAIQSLLPEYVENGTQVTTFEGIVVAINGELGLAPTRWNGSGWRPILFKPAPDLDHRGLDRNGN